MEAGRKNPFSEAPIEKGSDIFNLYNETNDSSSSNQTVFHADNFFEDPFPDIGAQSSIRNLESAVLQCKHMYLASREGPKTRQNFLLTHLIELRRLLHNAKEREHVGDFPSLSSTPGVSTFSTNTSSLPEGNSVGTIQTNTIGHSFQSVAALRLLGTMCESCSRSVKSPTGQILICQHCSAACHDSPACIRGLIRSCPSASAPSLDISRLTYMSASLSRQNWRCAGCHRRIGPPLSAEEAPSLYYGRPPRPPPMSEALCAAVERISENSKAHATTSWRMKICEMAGIYSPSLGPIQTQADSAVAAKITEAVDGDDFGGRKMEPAHLCYYLGEFFCSNCHWGDLWPIPANIFRLGISDVYPISRSAFLSLEYMWPRQQFRAPDAWQRWNPKALLICSLRLRAFRLNAYFRTCNTVLQMKQKFETEFPAWVLEQPYTYTMWTVEQALEGSLAESLETFLSSVAAHVLVCETCASFGQYICSVCRNVCPQPYEPLSVVCSVCWNAVHRSCVVPELQSTLEKDDSRLETLRKQSCCPNNLSVEDILEVFSPALKVTCKHCSENI